MQYTAKLTKVETQIFLLDHSKYRTNIEKYSAYLYIKEGNQAKGRLFENRILVNIWAQEGCEWGVAKAPQ